MSKRKIAVVTGSRSEYGLLYWLLREIHQDTELELQLIVTGAHLTATFGWSYRQIEVDGFEIREKVDMLLASDTSVGIAKSVGLGVMGFAESFSRLKPDLIVILGDRFESLAVAQAAVFLKIPLAHIHGGELTKGAIDDQIRHAITKMAHVHFPAAEEYRQRILQMGENPQRVFNFGAPGLDHVTQGNLLTKEDLIQKLDIHYAEQNFLITYHPVTLAEKSTHEGLYPLLAALEHFPQANLFFTVPNADEGSSAIIAALKKFIAHDVKKRFVFVALGTPIYLSLARTVDAVIGNSSSGLIEVPFMKLPTVNIGNRQEGRLLASSVINCGESTAEIVAAIKKALSETFRQSLAHVISPYGKGGVSYKIKEVLKTIHLASLRTKEFFNYESSVTT